MGYQAFSRKKKKKKKAPFVKAAKGAGLSFMEAVAKRYKQPTQGDYARLTSKRVSPGSAEEAVRAGTAKMAKPASTDTKYKLLEAFARRNKRKRKK